VAVLGTLSGNANLKNREVFCYPVHPLPRLHPSAPSRVPTLRCPKTAPSFGEIGCLIHANRPFFCSI
jgi:hypothetical protein